jgi:hypothetical protein
MVINRLIHAVRISTLAHVGLVLLSSTRPASGQAETDIICDPGTEFASDDLMRRMICYLLLVAVIQPFRTEPLPCHSLPWGTLFCWPLVLSIRRSANITLN